MTIPAASSALEAQFLSALPAIERVLEFVARRNRLSPDDAEEFGSLVKLKFIESEYEVLRKFEGRSSLQTYLSVVIQRLFLDYRIAAWGKWRPTAEAKRLGPLAVRLEMLQTRDGLSFEEACESICTGQLEPVSRQELYELSVRLPARASGRRFEGEDALLRVAAEGVEADRAVTSEEDRRMAARVSEAMRLALARLPAQDRIVLRMRFDGLRVADIARGLHLKEKPLYRRIEQVVAGLRDQLEKDGFSGSLVVAWLDGRSGDVSLSIWDGPWEDDPSSSSMGGGASA